MESAMILLTIMLVCIVLAIVGIAAYILFKYALVFIIAGCTGRIIDKFKK